MVGVGVGFGGGITMPSLPGRGAGSVRQLEFRDSKKLVVAASSPSFLESSSFERKLAELGHHFEEGYHILEEMRRT